MRCPRCQQRKAKRACPALGLQICSTCCGTERLTEIACPADCVYLAASRAHPAAAVQRQRERDVGVVLLMTEGLSPAQMGLLSLVHERLLAYRPTAIPAVTDADVRDAAGAVASTLETASRGILYEHQTGSMPAQRLVFVFREIITEVERRGAVPGGVFAPVFRRLEAASRQAAAIAGGGETAFLDVLDRLHAGARTAHLSEQPAADRPRPDAPRIILP